MKGCHQQAHLRTFLKIPEFFLLGVSDYNCKTSKKESLSVHAMLGLHGLWLSYLFVPAAQWFLTYVKSCIACASVVFFSLNMSPAQLA